MTNTKGRTVSVVLAGAAALMLMGSPALSQQDLTGMVTKIDRTRGTIAIQPDQSGTVGSNAGGPAGEFKAQDRASLDAVHAGDKVSYSVTEVGGVKTITKLKKQ